MAEPRSAIEALGRALIDYLREHDDVRPLLGQRIYDEVPSDQDRPKGDYAYLGPANRQRLESDCATQWTVRMRLFIASVEFGRYSAWAAADAVIAALDRNDTLPLAAPYTRNDIVRCFQDGDVVNPSEPKIVFIDISTIVVRD